MSLEYLELPGALWQTDLKLHSFLLAEPPGRISLGASSNERKRNQVSKNANSHSSIALALTTLSEHVVLLVLAPQQTVRQIVGIVEAVAADLGNLRTYVQRSAPAHEHRLLLPS